MPETTIELCPRTCRGLKTGVEIREPLDKKHNDFGDASVLKVKVFLNGINSQPYRVLTFIVPQEGYQFQLVKGTALRGGQRWELVEMKNGKPNGRRIPEGVPHPFTWGDIDRIFYKGILARFSQS